MEGRHTVGVIGGSGLYDIEGLTGLEEVQIETPFGSPSDAFMTGELDGVKMVFLPIITRQQKFFIIKFYIYICHLSISSIKLSVS